MIDLENFKLSLQDKKCLIFDSDLELIGYRSIVSGRYYIFEEERDLARVLGYLKYRFIEMFISRIYEENSLYVLRDHMVAYKREGSSKYSNKARVFFDIAVVSARNMRVMGLVRVVSHRRQVARDYERIAEIDAPVYNLLSWDEGGLVAADEIVGNARSNIFGSTPLRIEMSKAERLERRKERKARRLAKNAIVDNATN